MAVGIGYLQKQIGKSQMTSSPDGGVLDRRPIGIFDSGVGGLTVVKEIFAELPEEQVVYFGDAARAPYGPKSAEIVTEFAIENARFLISKKVKMIVIACNTASAVALNTLRERFDLPVLGVIEAGAKAVIRQTRNKKVGIIGTVGTIASNAYGKTIADLDPTVEIYTQPCPLFVALAEEGWTDKKATFLIAQEYLEPLKQRGIDTLLLGCTHYPLLKETIRQAIGDQVLLIDSAQEVAMEVRALLSVHQLIAAPGVDAHHEFYLSDMPLRFREIGERFLGSRLERIYLKRTKARLVRGLW